jgi:hypothetical protein
MRRVTYKCRRRTIFSPYVQLSFSWTLLITLWQGTDPHSFLDDATLSSVVASGLSALSTIFTKCTTGMSGCLRPPQNAAHQTLQKVPMSVPLIYSKAATRTSKVGDILGSLTNGINLSGSDRCSEFTLASFFVFVSLFVI